MLLALVAVPIAPWRMPLSSGITSSDSRYSIDSCASSGSPSHVGLMHQGCMAALSHPGNHSLAPQCTQVGCVASSWFATGSLSLWASCCCCAHRWWSHNRHSIWAAIRGHLAGSPRSPRGGSPGLWASTGTGAMCCTNCAPGIASSAKACAGGRPCPIVRVGVTFPMRMSSFSHCQSLKVASRSKSIPESPDPRLNFRQCLTRHCQQLRQDCGATMSLPANQVASGCMFAGLGASGWPAFGAASAAGWSLAKPRAAAK